MSPSLRWFNPSEEQYSMSDTELMKRENGCLPYTISEAWRRKRDGLGMLLQCGDLHHVQSILRQQGYHSILKMHAIPFILQLDNDPKRSLQLCRNYLEKRVAIEMLSVVA